MRSHIFDLDRRLGDFVPTPGSVSMMSFTILNFHCWALGKKVEVQTPATLWIFSTNLHLQLWSMRFMPATGGCVENLHRNSIDLSQISPSRPGLTWLRNMMGVHSNHYTGHDGRSKLVQSAVAPCRLHEQLVDEHKLRINALRCSRGTYTDLW